MWNWRWQFRAWHWRSPLAEGGGTRRGPLYCTAHPRKGGGERGGRRGRRAGGRGRERAQIRRGGRGVGEAAGGRGAGGSAAAGRRRGQRPGGRGRAAAGLCDLVGSRRGGGRGRGGVISAGGSQGLDLDVGVVGEQGVSGPLFPVWHAWWVATEGRADCVPPRTAPLAALPSPRPPGGGVYQPCALLIHADRGTLPERRAERRGGVPHGVAGHGRCCTTGGPDARPFRARAPQRGR